MAYKDKNKQREYQRKWRAKRRAEFFADKSCVECGSKEKLELDHIDRTEKTRKTDHGIWTWAKEKQEKELKKCQILCHDCHWKKTRQDLGYGRLIHGTITAYKNYKCRCPSCRKINAEVEFNRRKNKIWKQ